MGWTWCRLHEIYSENNVGIVIRPTQYYTSSDKGIPAFRNTNIKPNKIDETSWVYLSHHGIQDNPRCIVHENDLLVSRSGNAGICCVATKKYEGYGAVDILLISLFPFCSSFFISNCINSPIVQQAISRNNRGVALSHIGTNTFANILLPLPPFSEQKRIVVQIDSLLKCLEEINQESETLEKSLTLAKQKILDLAIRGKLVPQDPNDEPASELLKKIKAEKETLIKSGKLKRDKHESFIFRGDDNCYYEQIDGKRKNISSDIPMEIPQNWTWVRLKNLCLLITDGTHQTPEYSESGYIFLSSMNVTSGRIDWDNVKYIPEKLHKELHERLAPQIGDILLAKNGTIGYAAIVDKNIVFDIYVSLALLRPCQIAVYNTFLHQIIGSSAIQNFFAGEKKGIGLYNLHLENIRQTLIPLPPINEQQRIAGKIAEINLILESMLK